MVYDAGRLTEKHYSRLPYNDVTYRYENGRVVEVTDGSGRQEISYDHLGNMSKNIRTFATKPCDNLSSIFYIGIIPQIKNIYYHLYKDNNISNTFIGYHPLFSLSPTALKQDENGMFLGVEFTGKETDCETGLSYFGARYYDPTLLTSWTAVDPMADKYPSLSPYNYCAWNPMRLVDPDGNEMWKPEVLADGSVNYIKEDYDNAKTLKEQYGLTESAANRLYNTIKNGKISGNDVQKVTGSKILKYNSSYRNPKKSQDIKQKIYHAGFAALYSHINGDGTFKLNDFFTGIGDDYSGIVSRDGWGNRPFITIPKLGGGDIPINEFSCQSGGVVELFQNGEIKFDIKLRDIRTGEAASDGCSITYYQEGKKRTEKMMPGFSITFRNKYLNDIKASYID